MNPGTVAVTRIIEFDAGHRVPSHEGMCRNPHGHRYRVELTVTGPVHDQGSEDGMVIDFGRIKQFLTTQVHDRYDHGFIVHADDEIMREALAAGDPDWNVVVVPFVPTAENLAASIGRAAGILAPLHVASCVVYETPNSWATWTPPN